MSSSSSSSSFPLARFSRFPPSFAHPVYAFRLLAISRSLLPSALFIPPTHSRPPTSISRITASAASLSLASCFSKLPPACFTAKLLYIPSVCAKYDKTLAGVCGVDDHVASQGKGNLDAIAAVLQNIGITPEEAFSICASHPDLFNVTSADELVAGIRSLQQLGLDKDDIARIVEQFPSVVVNLDEKLSSLSQLFDDLGIEKGLLLGKLLKVNAGRVATSAEFSIRRFITFCSDYNLSVEDAAESMRRYPQIAIFSSLNMFRVVDYLKEFAITDQEIGLIIRNHPKILTCNVDKNLKPKVRFLMEVGVDTKGIGAVLKKQPQLFGSSIENSLKPKIKYMQSVGFQQADIVRLVVGNPSSFSRCVAENLVGTGELLLSLGFQMGSVQFCRVASVALAASPEYLQRRVNWFISVGFRREDIFIMLRGNPCLLLKNENHLGLKVNYLINNMQYPLGVLVTHPVFLNLSIENRIKPRHRVAMFLKSKGILKKNPSLSFFTSCSNERFKKRYVDRHPGCDLAFERDQVDVVTEAIMTDLFSSHC